MTLGDKLLAGLLILVALVEAVFLLGYAHGITHAPMRDDYTQKALVTDICNEARQNSLQRVTDTCSYLQTYYHVRYECPSHQNCITVDLSN